MRISQEPRGYWPLPGLERFGAKWGPTPVTGVRAAAEYLPFTYYLPREAYIKDYRPTLYTFSPSELRQYRLFPLGPVYQSEESNVVYIPQIVPTRTGEWLFAISKPTYTPDRFVQYWWCDITGKCIAPGRRSYTSRYGRMVL